MLYTVHCCIIIGKYVCCDTSMYVQSSKLTNSYKRKKNYFQILHHLCVDISSPHLD